MRGGDKRLSFVSLLIFSAFFSLAVLLGNYSLFEPLSVLQNLFDIVLNFFGGIIIGYHILLYICTHFPQNVEATKRKEGVAVFCFVFGSIAAIDILFLFFSIYPGVLTTDSFSTIAQILGEQEYNNTMPYWHTVTVGLFLKLGLYVFKDINAAVALVHVVQILFMASCLGYVLMTLYQIGVPVFMLLVVYSLYAFMPYNIVYSVTLWKDIPFAGATILFITAFYRILKGLGNNKNNYIFFIIGTIGFSLLRTNGWYAFGATTLVMFLVLRKRNKKLLKTMTLVLIFCWILIGPFLELLNVTETNYVEAFAVPMQQIARVVTNGRGLTDNEELLLREIFWLEKIPEMYDPLTVDPIKYETFRYDKVTYILENLSDYMKLYVSLGMKYPEDYLKAWIDETKGYWNGGYFFWTYTLKMGSNNFGIYHITDSNIISKLFAMFFRYIEKPEILQFTISIGLYVWGIVSCMIINIIKKRDEFLLTIPLMVLIIGLWIGTPVYSEFRYAYPMILSLPLILCVTIFRKKDEN